ncbi:hypothetical protein CYMTET_16579 [Cymbomonas tetramitiformis]|uniref:Ion transport domain-containing protein n=1 Tax=Cymbomonas tetramitiformis TaxID=36881 RepID=A0AAE0GC70_9CHLO|nr:hypothetical protein CYMTET_16579 [Cymbomonas tetramitiformis]
MAGHILYGEQYQEFKSAGTTLFNMFAFVVSGDWALINPVFFPERKVDPGPRRHHHAPPAPQAIPRLASITISVIAMVDDCERYSDEGSEQTGAEPAKGLDYNVGEYIILYTFIMGNCFITLFTLVNMLMAILGDAQADVKSDFTSGLSKAPGGLFKPNSEGGYTAPSFFSEMGTSWQSRYPSKVERMLKTVEAGIEKAAKHKPKPTFKGIVNQIDVKLRTLDSMAESLKGNLTKMRSIAAIDWDWHAWDAATWDLSEDEKSALTTLREALLELRHQRKQNRAASQTPTILEESVLDEECVQRTSLLGAPC